MYANLAGKVKNNHIFLRGGGDYEEVTFLTLHQSNSDNHTASTHKVSKRSRQLRSPVEVQVFLEKMTMMNYVGMNPYKVVEMW